MLKERLIISLTLSIDYGIAVSVAICMLLSALLFVESGRQEVIYVVNTGYQSMDSVKLADGTKVMLGAGSKLTYPQKFSGSNREVKLSGQAFFNVSQINLIRLL